MKYRNLPNFVPNNIPLIDSNLPAFIEHLAIVGDDCKVLFGKVNGRLEVLEKTSEYDKQFIHVQDKQHQQAQTADKLTTVYSLGVVHIEHLYIYSQSLAKKNVKGKSKLQRTDARTFAYNALVINFFWRLPLAFIMRLKM